MADKKLIKRSLNIIVTWKVTIPFYFYVETRSLLIIEREISGLIEIKKILYSQL